MALTLEKVVPWGRSFSEYRRMFALTDIDLKKRILGCADGPASFNVELTAAGGTVVSFDPIYTYSAHAIRRQIESCSSQIIDYARRNTAEFVWSDELPDPDALARLRMGAMEQFLADYEPGRQAGRYVAAELPTLPFSNRAFDIAVCSHFLYLYSEQLSEEFHLEAIGTLMRVADDVRIFPLLQHGARPSPHVEPVAEALRHGGFQVAIVNVDYEFQRGGNQMMRITR